MFVLILKWFIFAFIIFLFLYSKLGPYKDRLTGGYLKYFNFFDRMASPVLGFLRQIFKPVTAGRNLQIDMSQLVLLIILLILIQVL